MKNHYFKKKNEKVKHDIVAMSKRELLEYANLHKCDLHTEIPENSIVCRCRFGHNFMISSVSEWCQTCKSPEFLQELLMDTDEEIKTGSVGLELVDVNYFGIAIINCENNHNITCDIDDIPSTCKFCDELGIVHEDRTSNDFEFDDDNLAFIHDIYEDSDDSMGIYYNAEEEKSGDSHVGYQSDTDDFLADIMKEWNMRSIQKPSEKFIKRKYRPYNLKYSLEIPQL